MMVFFPLPVRRAASDSSRFRSSLIRKLDVTEGTSSVYHTCVAIWSCCLAFRNQLLQADRAEQLKYRAVGRSLQSRTNDPLRTRGQGNELVPFAPGAELLPVVWLYAR